MNDPNELLHFLQAQFPTIEFNLDAAETADGSSWINIQGDTIAIEHRPSHGMGLFLSADDGYGSRPDEVYRDANLLIRRLTQLLPAVAMVDSEAAHLLAHVGKPLAHTTRKQITLKGIREILGVTQAEVAKALGKQQSAISRLEQRDDVLISTLVALIHGLDGEIEIKASFKECDVLIYADENG